MTPTRRHLAGAGLVALLTAVTYGASAQAPDGAGTDSDADPGTIMPPHAPPPSDPDLSQRSGLRDEPFALHIEGWIRTDDDVPGAWQRTTTLERGDATVTIDRWWGVPQTDGGPMSIVDRRDVTIDGRTVELLHTDAFEGHADEVDAVFIRGTGWLVRVVLRGCSPADEADVLDAIDITGAW